jgi:hypothetical protein
LFGGVGGGGGGGLPACGKRLWF